MTIKNRLANLNTTDTANPYEKLTQADLLTLQIFIAKMQKDLLGLLVFAPTSLHSVLVVLNKHAEQVKNALAQISLTSHDVITDSMNWERDVLGYNPHIVYQMTTLPELASSIRHATDNGYRYITTYTFLDTDTKCIVVYRLNNLRNSPLAHNEKIYADFIEWAKTMGVVYVEGVPF